MKRKLSQKIAAGISVITGVGITLLALAGFLLFVPRLFAVTPYIVMSGSMEPEIHTGGIAYVDTQNDRLRSGDIITFRVSDKLVTHRIVRIDETGIYTQGDANAREDPAPIEKAQVIGKVCLALPYLGYLAAFIQSKRGIAAMLLLLFSHMLSWDFRQAREKEWILES